MVYGEIVGPNEIEFVERLGHSPKVCIHKDRIKRPIIYLFRCSCGNTFSSSRVISIKNGNTIGCMCCTEHRKDYYELAKKINHFRVFYFGTFGNFLRGIFAHTFICLKDLRRVVLECSVLRGKFFPHSNVK